MDDTPHQLMHELRSSLLKKFVGRIAVAIILAEACLRFLNALTWFLVIPVIATVLRGNTESVLFKNQRVFPWEQLFGSIVEFAGTLIFVFYVNRWINHPVSEASTISVDDSADQQQPPITEEATENDRRTVTYNLVGQPVDSEDDDNPVTRIDNG